MVRNFCTSLWTDSVHFYNCSFLPQPFVRRFGLVTLNIRAGRLCSFCSTFHASAFTYTPNKLTSDRCLFKYLLILNSRFDQPTKSCRLYFPITKNGAHCTLGSGKESDKGFSDSS